MFWMVFFFRNNNTKNGVVTKRDRHINKDDLLRNYEEYIKKVVRNTVVKNEKLFKYFDWEDLYQEGRIAFLNAVESYNETSGCKLSTYAARIIHNRLISLLRKKAVKNVYQEESAEKSVLLTETEDGESRMKTIETEDERLSMENRAEFRVNFGPVFELMREISENHPDKAIRYGMQGVMLVYMGYTVRDAAKKVGISNAYMTLGVRKARALLNENTVVKEAFGRY